eukprot:gene33734-39508_t
MLRDEMRQGSSTRATEWVLHPDESVRVALAIGAGTTV